MWFPLWLPSQPQWTTRFYFKGLINIQSRQWTSHLNQQDLKIPGSWKPSLLSFCASSYPLTPTHTHPSIPPTPSWFWRTSPRPNRVVSERKYPHAPTLSSSPRSWERLERNGLTVWKLEKARRQWRNSMPPVISTHARWVGQWHK